MTISDNLTFNIEFFSEDTSVGQQENVKNIGHSTSIREF